MATPLAPRSLHRVTACLEGFGVRIAPDVADALAEVERVEGLRPSSTDATTRAVEDAVQRLLEHAWEDEDEYALASRLILLTLSRTLRRRDAMHSRFTHPDRATGAVTLTNPED